MPGTIKIPWRPYTAPSISTLLDTYSTGAMASYSLRRLKGSYNGPAVRVRRSYDNETYDVGFVGYDQLDSTGLKNFVDAGSSLHSQDLSTWNSISYTASVAVTSGLVMDIDAGTAASYPGSGTTVTSLAGSLSGSMAGISYEASNGGTLGLSGTGSNIAISGPVLSSSSNFTISAWVYTDRLPALNGKLISWGSGINSLSIGITGSFAGTNITLSASYPTYTYQNYAPCITVGSYSCRLDEQYSGQWMDLTVTNSNGSVSIYVNGSEAHSYSGATFSLDSNPFIGSNPDGSMPLVCRLSRMRIYDRALTRQEVFQNYSQSTSRYAQDHDALAFINAAGLTSSTHINAVHKLVRDLKANKFWDKLWVIYPFVGGNANAHKFNLKDPRDANSAFRIQFNGGWTHSATGALPNGSNAWANTFYNPSTFTYSAYTSVPMRMNQVTYYTNTSTSSTGIDFGHRSSNTYGWYFQLNNGGYTRYQELYDVNAYGGSLRSINTGGGTGNWTFIKSRNLQWGAVTNCFQNYLYTFRNGTYMSWIGLAEETRGYFSPINLDIYFGAVNFQGTAQSFSNKEVSFLTIGDVLNSNSVGTVNEMSRLETIIQRFQTSLGRQVASSYPTITHPDSDTENFLSAAQITNATQSSAVAELVSAMKVEGIWHKPMALYPFVGATASSHSINLKSSRFDIGFGGGWTHSSTGAKPNGTNAAGYIYLMPAVEFADNVAGHFGFYTRTDSNSTGYDIGARDAASNWKGLVFSNKRVLGNIGCGMTPITDSLESTGFNFAMRGDSAGFKSKRAFTMKNDTIDYVDSDNGDFGTAANTNMSAERGNIFLMLSAIDIATGYGAQLFSDREFSFATIGNRDMTELQALKYSRIVNRFQQRLGRAANLVDMPFDAGLGTVQTWYDQSGNSRHLYMKSRASQPAIYKSGSVIKDANDRPAIQFDGWNDALFSAQNINFTTARTIVAVSSGTASGIRTGSNNSTIQSTTVGNYQMAATTWTSTPRMNNFRMPLRPFGDNSYYTINASSPGLAGQEGSSVYGWWGGYSPVNQNVILGSGVNILSSWVGEEGRQRSGANFLCDAIVDAGYGSSYVANPGSLFMGGYMVQGTYYMSKMKMQELLMFDTTFAYERNKRGLEVNIYSYYLPFPSSTVSDPDAKEFANMLRLNSTQANAINSLVVGLKNANLWEKMVNIYPFVGGEYFKHSMDLKTRSYSFYSGSRIRFTTDQYGNTTGTSITHNSGGVAYPKGPNIRGNLYTSLSSQYTANNFHSSFYYGGMTASGPWWMGNRAGAWRSDGSNVGRMALWIQKNDTYFEKANGISNATPTIQGYYITNSSASTNALYKDGTLLGTASIPAGATMSNAGVMFGDDSSMYQSFTTFGYGLTSQDVQALNTIVQQYQQDLGRKLT